MRVLRMSGACIVIVFAASCVGVKNNDPQPNPIGTGLFAGLFTQAAHPGVEGQEMMPALRFGYQVNSEIFSTLSPLFSSEPGLPTLRTITDFVPIRLDVDETEDAYHQFLLDGASGRVWINDGRGHLDSVSNPHLVSAFGLEVARDGTLFVAAPGSLCRFQMQTPRQWVFAECAQISMARMAIAGNSLVCVDGSGSSLFRVDSTTLSAQPMPLNILISDVTYVHASGGTLIVVDHHGSRVTVLDYSGAVLAQNEFVTYTLFGDSAPIDLPLSAIVPHAGGGYLAIAPQSNVLVYLDPALRVQSHWFFSGMPIPFRMPEYLLGLRVSNGIVHILDAHSVTVMYDTKEVAPFDSWAQNIPDALRDVILAVNADEVGNALQANPRQNIFDTPAVKQALIAALASQRVGVSE